jgi:6-phosphogluconolactonase
MRYPILGTGRGRIPAFILVPDEGPGRVFTPRLDTSTGRLVPAGDAPAREGAGPRLVALHPSNAFAYAVNELDSTVTAYRFDPEAGNLHPFQVVSALPDTFIGHSRAAEIAVSSDGRFVYASNRGHDGIATLAVDPASGRLARVGWTNSLGRTPRFFTLDPTGSSVVVANEDRDSIIAFEVDPWTGVLERGREVARTGSSVCIVFATTA